MKLNRTAVVAGVAAAVTIATQSGPAISQSGTPLTGTLKLTAGKAVRENGRTQYTGTYFRMLLPGATDQYFKNPDSHAKDQTYTLLRPGSDGGLQLGKYQPAPASAFSANGFALAHRITQPQTFASINFSISTAHVDPQSGATDAPPSLVVRGNKITGNLSAWTAEWNKIYFNQGAPKPNAASPYPGGTRPVTGTYNSKTKAFTITWYSLIVGGPFNGFTGFWHLQGSVER